MAAEQKPEPPKQSKAFATDAISSDLEKRSIRHYITLPTVDEDGEVLLPRGVDLSRFTKSGTVFDVHEYGTDKVMGINAGLEISDQGIIANTMFCERPPTHPKEVEWRPDTVGWLYHKKYIKGWSIGFLTQESRQPTRLDKETYGEACKKVITRWKLLEYSCAPLPCNGDAITLSAKGFIVKSLAERMAKGEWPKREQDGSPPAPEVPPVEPQVAPPPPAKRKVYLFIEEHPVPATKAAAPEFDAEAFVAGQIAFATARAKGLPFIET